MPVQTFCSLTCAAIVSAFVATASVARAQDAHMLPGPDRAAASGSQATPQVHSFGNWIVKQDEVTQGYSLTGRATGSERGEVWLRCEKNGALLVGVPMPGRGTDKDRRKTQQITIRADDVEAREMTFLVFDGFVALAMDAEGLQNERVGAFIDMLAHAKHSFALSYDQTVIEFDVRGFTAARARFAQLCAPRPAH